MNRHFTHQPNVPGRGIISAYGRRFWCVLTLLGIATGLGAAALTLLLNLVEQRSWSYRMGDFQSGVARTGPFQHIVVLLLAGTIAGIGALGIRRVRGSGAGEIAEALWIGEAHLSFWKSQARGVLSIVIVGMGASLGREGAPQLTGAAVATVLSERAKLPLWQRRLLVASGAGAGMAAVYNVPLGGALFAVEVLLGTLTLPIVIPALLTSAIATVVAWLVVPTGPSYRISTFTVHLPQVLWAILIGPLAGLVAVGWIKVIVTVNERKPRGWGRVVAPVIVFGLLGAVAIAYPGLLGNGKDAVERALTDHLTLGVIVVLLLLKPIATAACLGSGAPGGLLTPTLTLGVLFGALLGHLWMGIWPSGTDGAYALIGGAAVLGGAMQGPLAATVLVLEFTHNADGLMVPLLLAVAEATVVSRLFGAQSIYSARIRRDTLTTQDERIGPLEPPPSGRADPLPAP
ncbi:MAG TPA: chloride channel protein [Solirubrobacteraceae bacterium]|nr:chloride channel protein [Solirubrobacteraceae bacterium]